MLLALSIFLTTGTTLSANAQVVENEEDRTQTIQDPTGEGEQEARIEVNSQIGAFDNTNPDGPDPIGPDLQPDPYHPTWLNITVPTVVAFYSTGAYHGDLASADFTITNNSGRGVDVHVVGFNHTNYGDPNGRMDVIETLALRPEEDLIESNTVALVDEDGIINTPNELLMTIERVPEHRGATEATFEFVGTTQNIGTASASPAFELILEFTVNGTY